MGFGVVTRPACRLVRGCQGCQSPAQSSGAQETVTRGLPECPRAGDLLERKSMMWFSQPKGHLYSKQVQRLTCFPAHTSCLIYDVGLGRLMSLEIAGFAGPQNSSTCSYFSFPALRQGWYFPTKAAMTNQLIKTQGFAAVRCQLK